MWLKLKKKLNLTYNNLCRSLLEREREREALPCSLLMFLRPSLHEQRKHSKSVQAIYYLSSELKLVL